MPNLNYAQVWEPELLEILMQGRVIIRMQKENGWMIGYRAEVKQILHRMHLRDFTRRRVVCDAEDHRHP